MFRRFLIAINLQHPYKMESGRGVLQTTFKAGTLLKKPPIKKGLVQFDVSAGLARHLDRMIGYVEYEHLRTQQKVVSAAYFCAHCGHGISLKGCPKCNGKFNDNRFQPTTAGELPFNVKWWFAEQGHRFKR